MTGEAETFRRKLTSFGRRKGKTLRSYHSSLMESLLPVAQFAAESAREPRALFPARCSELWLEIGFGGGEHLAADALRHRDVAFIGCEPFVNGVAKLLAHIDEDQLDNVRIFPGDAREVLNNLPGASVARVNILYPDPWPKSRQKKRRFISDETLVSLARVMKPGTELRFATDIDDYSAWTLSRIARSPHFDWRQTMDTDWLTPWEFWPSTRYEAKALREGRKPVYLTFIRNDAAAVPV
jgi:tRNA (guanine-N7-)-methyltransferase